MGQRTQDQPTSASVRSFLVADIRGYTSYTAAKGDEAAARLVERFAELISDGVTAWSGAVVELRGDEALAAFESPRSALRAAVELQAALVDETRDHPSDPLDVGIGLDAGEAVPVGEGYRGAALNRAARLCSAAKAGEILASAELIHLAGPVAGIEFAQSRPVTAKGLDEPVDAVAVSATSDDPDGDTTSTGEAGPPPPIPPALDPIVPLAGRQRELGWLRWHWRRARHGHARCVILSGIPGIGKTRLAAALAAVAHEDGGTVTYLPTAIGVADAAGSASTEPRPTLLVVDDIDAASGKLVRATVDAAAVLDGRVLLLVTHRTEASAELLRSLEALAPAELRQELGPLDFDAIRQIASLYAGDAVDQLPLADIAEQTSGHPATVHRLSHELARRLATQRVGASAGRTETGRLDMRAAEAALIDDIALLEHARESGLLYDERRDSVDASDRGRGTCPYKGLEAYGSGDADLFFGRERLVGELTARLVGSPFLAIVGASGSGKSSAIHAGLLPSLAAGALPGSDAWPQVTIRPGDQPMNALAQALCQRFEDLCRDRHGADAPGDAGALLDAVLAAIPRGGRLVLFVDQFEEVFSTADAATRTNFIDTICGDHPGLLVIVAMRADHYGHAAAYPALARLLASHNVLVGTLTHDELVAVIERPAERVGLHVEPGLVDALVEDAGAEPSVLPLLSTALLESWTLRDGDRMTLAAYQAGGGLHGSVARLAEGVWTSLDPDRQAVARAMLLRLAGGSEAEGSVRRRVPRAEFDLEDDALAADVLDRLVSARLLTTADDSVEVTHEALLREWPRLRGWLDDDATGHQLHLHLAAAAQEWGSSGRTGSDLYRGARLTAALDWGAEHPEQLNSLEREFLEASQAATDEEAERQRRTNRRLRFLVAGIGVLLIAAVGAGAFASLQASRAEDAAQRADQERLAATASALVASSILEVDSDPSLSKLLALEAASIDQRPDVLTGLHTALAADSVEQRVSVADENGELSWGRVDPSGRWMVTSGTKPDPRDGMEVYDLGSEATEPVWRYEAAPGAVVSLPRFTPDGTRLVAGVFVRGDVPGTDGPSASEQELGIGVWRPPSEGATDWVLSDWIDVGACGARLEDVSDHNALIELPPDPESACLHPEFQAPGPVEVVGFDDHVARRLLESFAAANPRDLLSSDGRTAVVGNAERGLSAVIDTDTLEERWIGAFDDAWPVALSGDGSLLLVEGRSGLEVVDIDSGQVTASKPHPGGIVRGQFRPGTESLVTVGFDATLSVWDGRSGRELSVHPSTGGSWPHWFDDRIGVIDSGGPAMIIVDPRPRGEPLAIDLCAGADDRASLVVPPRNLDVAGDRVLTTFDCEHEFRDGPSGVPAPSVMLDPETGDVVLSLEGNAGGEQAISPDQIRFARQERMTTDRVAIRDLASGDIIAVMDPVCIDDAEPDPVTGCPDGHLFMDWLHWSNDGRYLAGGAHHDAIIIWDAALGEVVTVIRPQGDGFDFWGSTFSPDDARLIVSNAKWPELSRIDSYSTDTWELVRSISIDPETTDKPVALVGWSADGSILYGLGGAQTGAENQTLVWIDAETLEKQGVVIRLHEATAMDAALSPDRTRLASASASGEIRVWDLATRQLDHEVQLEDIFPDRSPVGVAWKDDTRIIVVTENGMLAEFTTDADELMDLVTASLTRGFTTDECARYEIDPCPSLEEAAHRRVRRG